MKVCCSYFSFILCLGSFLSASLVNAQDASDHEATIEELKYEIKRMEADSDKVYELLVETENTAQEYLDNYEAAKERIAELNQDVKKLQSSQSNTPGAIYWFIAVLLAVIGFSLGRKTSCCPPSTE